MPTSYQRALFGKSKCVLVLAHIMQIKDGCDAKILMNNKNDVFRCYMCESNDLLRANKNRNIKVTANKKALKLSCTLRYYKFCFI